MWMNVRTPREQLIRVKDTNILHRNTLRTYYIILHAKMHSVQDIFVTYFIKFPFKIILICKKFEKLKIRYRFDVDENLFCDWF